jgi:hypothetical protein
MVFYDEIKEIRKTYIQINNSPTDKVSAVAASRTTKPVLNETDYMPSTVAMDLRKNSL